MSGFGGGSVLAFGTFGYTIQLLDLAGFVKVVGRCPQEPKFLVRSNELAANAQNPQPQILNPKRERPLCFVSPKVRKSSRTAFVKAPGSVIRPAQPLPEMQWKDELIDSFSSKN